MIAFIGRNIMFWNCQGIGSKRKELELYLKENSFDIVAQNETFLSEKVDFKIQGYENIKNDCSTWTGVGVTFLLKHGLVINKEYHNIDFNIITDNEALVIDTDSDTLIRIVKFLKRGKAPGPDKIHNEVLRLGTTISLFHHLSRLFTSSIQIG